MSVASITKVRSTASTTMFDRIATRLKIAFTWSTQRSKFIIFKGNLMAQAWTSFQMAGWRHDFRFDASFGAFVQKITSNMALWLPGLCSRVAFGLIYSLCREDFGKPVGWGTGLMCLNDSESWWRGHDMDTHSMASYNAHTNHSLAAHHQSAWSSIDDYNLRSIIVKNLGLLTLPRPFDLNRKVNSNLSKFLEYFRSHSPRYHLTQYQYSNIHSPRVQSLSRASLEQTLPIHCTAKLLIWVFSG